MSKIRCAIIGCGRISKNHVAALNNNFELATLVAVCDVIPEHMEASLSVYEHGRDAVKRYSDYKEMITTEQPDMVSIATESGQHAEMALFAVNNGCNVLIEKPIALNLADADAIIAAAKANGVKVCACHQNRFNKAIQKIRSAVEAGDFGKLFHATAHIRWNRGEDYYKQAPWRGTWESDGGALMNQCIHNIDLLRWMMGDDITEVFGFTDKLNHDYISAEDLGIAVIKFANGAYGIVEGTTNVFPENLEETLYIFGESGTVKAGGKSTNLIEEWRFANSTESRDEVIKKYAEISPNVYGFGHTPLYTDMLKAIRDGREPYVNGEAGRRALELVLAIYKSAATGVAVKLPMSDCSTMDFKGRFN